MTLARRSALNVLEKVEKTGVAVATSCAEMLHVHLKKTVEKLLVAGDPEISGLKSTANRKYLNENAVALVEIV